MAALGTHFESDVDGVARSHRDVHESAIEAARILLVRSLREYVRSRTDGTFAAM